MYLPIFQVLSILILNDSIVKYQKKAPQIWFYSSPSSINYLPSVLALSSQNSCYLKWGLWLLVVVFVYFSRLEWSGICDRVIGYWLLGWWSGMRWFVLSLFTDVIGLDIEEMFSELFISWIGAMLEICCTFWICLLTWYGEMKADENLFGFIGLGFIFLTETLSTLFPIAYVFPGDKVSFLSTELRPKDCLLLFTSIFLKG